MNYTQHQSGAEGELSDEQKRAWDRIIEKLGDYLETEEGIEFYERFVAVFQKTPPLHVIILTPNETKALHYIRREKRRGHSPSVREVAKALGFRSSRTGFKIMRLLRGKGVV
jgi:LexA DNA binding domain